MDKLLKARKRMAKNSKKGFTLVELIVVIVILAILIAALTPAILGVINRANIAADEADVRSMMMAGSVVGMSQSPPGFPRMSDPSSDFDKEFTGGVNIQPGFYTIFFDGAVAVGGVLWGDPADTAIGPRGGAPAEIGNIDSEQKISLKVDAGGEISKHDSHYEDTST